MPLWIITCPTGNPAATNCAKRASTIRVVDDKELPSQCHPERSEAGTLPAHLKRLLHAPVLFA